MRAAAPQSLPGVPPDSTAWPGRSLQRVQPLPLGVELGFGQGQFPLDHEQDVRGDERLKAQTRLGQRREHFLLQMHPRRGDEFDG